MELLVRYFSQIRKQLAALTMTHKLLVGLLLVIVMGTIVVVFSISAKPELVPLLAQDSTPEEITEMTNYLKGKYHYEVVGQKIMVPMDSAYAIRGELGAAQALPKDTTAAFSALAAQTTWIQPEASQERVWTLAKQEVLAKIIRNFPFVHDATVMIAKGERAGLGRQAVPTSASVWIRTKSGDGITQSQLLAIVDLVKGSVTGLHREDVSVTDGKQTYRAPSEDTAMPADVLGWKKSLEDYYTGKLASQFANMGDVRIAVNVTPDMSAKTIRREKYDPNPISVPKRETTTKEKSSSGGTPSGQPGVQPNVSAVAAGSMGGNAQQQEKSDVTSDNEVRVGSEITNSISPAGSEIKDLTASISVPRSVFVKIYKNRYAKPAAAGSGTDGTGTGEASDADPEDSLLEPIIKEHTDKMQKLAMNVLGVKTPEAVRVDWFDDSYMTHMGPAVSATESFLAKTGAISSLAVQYAKPLVLLGIAFFAVMMLLMMVRKAAATSMGIAGADGDPSAFYANGGAGGGSGGGNGSGGLSDDEIIDAGSGEAVLDGIEVDEESMATRKMEEEVAKMIKDNPEGAAAMVQRWITKGK